MSCEQGGGELFNDGRQAGELDPLSFESAPITKIRWAHELGIKVRAQDQRLSAALSIGAELMLSSCL
jgi:hypothetical protein